jgi:hypothetical protein
MTQEMKLMENNEAAEALALNWLEQIPPNFSYKDVFNSLASLIISMAIECQAAMDIEESKDRVGLVLEEFYNICDTHMERVFESKNKRSSPNS